MTPSNLTNHNLIREEINRRLNFGNACYHSVQNLLSFCLPSRNLKIRIYKTIILPVVLCVCVCETWTLVLIEKHRLKAFENNVLRRMGGWRKLHNEELHDLYSSPSIIRIVKACSSNGGEFDRVKVIGRKSRGKEITRKTKM
jgi:hypothetical protein